MGLLSFLSALSPAHINFFTALRGGKSVGKDEYGNRYFRASPRAGYKHERRWVMYQGTPDASKVPPEWHGWLHYQTDHLPEDAAPSFRRLWQKPHISNLTGTNQAYHPLPHDEQKAAGRKATGDYTAWAPPR